MSLAPLPPTFCWTKMGAESGEELTAIVTRKEWERQLGEGTFLWGIGQSLGSVAEKTAGELRRLPAIFSPMPSRPKAIDVTPGDIQLVACFFRAGICLQAAAGKGFRRYERSG
jgi:hypothetical protein